MQPSSNDVPVPHYWSRTKTTTNNCWFEGKFIPCDELVENILHATVSTTTMATTTTTTTTTTITTATTPFMSEMLSRLNHIDASLANGKNDYPSPLQNVERTKTSFFDEQNLVIVAGVMTLCIGLIFLVSLMLVFYILKEWRNKRSRTRTRSNSKFLFNITYFNLVVVLLTRSRLF
jgi:hypothetical protein